jgi:hypothetical protein
VTLSDLVYRICGVHGTDEALALAVSSELSIFRSLVSTGYRRSNKSVNITQESDYHAIVTSKYKKIIKVHCGTQHESVEISVLEHCSKRTVNGVTREAVDKKYSSKAYLAPSQASRLFHKDCWKEHIRRSLKTKFTTMNGTQPNVVECLACSRVGCKPLSVVDPPASVTVVYDISLYKQALPMLLVLHRLDQVSPATCLIPDTESDEDVGGSSAKRARVDEDSESDTDSDFDDDEIAIQVDDNEVVIPVRP